MYANLGHGDMLITGGGTGGACTPKIGAPLLKTNACNGWAQSSPYPVRPFVISYVAHYAFIAWIIPLKL